MIEVAVFPKFLYVEAINLLVFILIMKLVSKILSFLNKKKYVNNDGSQLREYSIIKGYIYAIAAVSYTHLDVYKRQELICEAVGALLFLNE